MSVSTFEIKQCKLALTVTFFMHTFCVHLRARKTILLAQKSVHANIKFVEPRLW